MKRSIKIGALIFSRHDSSRLPGKALLKINGQELLGRVIARSKQLKGISGVVVATSDRQIDDKIAQFANSHEVDVFRGEVDDVAKRAIDACTYFGWEAFVRVCGDRPFFDVSIVNSSIEKMAYQQCDLVTTSGEYPLPPGLTTEVISHMALLKCHDHLGPYEREHLTSFFYRRDADFDICYMDYPSICKVAYPTTLVVDNDHDLRRADFVAKKLESDEQPFNQSSQQLLKLAHDWDQCHLNNDTCSVK